MDDLSIIRLIKKEPSDGLRAVLLQYGGFLKAVTVSILGIKNREDIEECISDTLCETLAVD